MFKSFTKQIEKFAVDNAPSLLTGVAVIGTAVTGYLAARGGLKAQCVIDEDLESAHPTLSMDMVGNNRKLQIAKMTWSCYIPAIGAGATTIAAVICANKINAGRIAAMAAAYSLSEKRLTEYKHKIMEKLDPEYEAAIQNEIDDDRLKKTNVPSTLFLGGNDVLCFDSYSGRYFNSDMESIRQASNDVNFMVIQERFATLSDFWEALGLDETAYSTEFGWTSDCPLVVSFKPYMSKDDKPCLMIDYEVIPVRGYNHLD